MVVNWDSLGVLSFVTTLMSCSVSSNGFIALHSDLSHVTDHWGISQNSSTHVSYKREFSETICLKDSSSILKLYFLYVNN